MPSRSASMQPATSARTPRRETIFKGLCVPDGSSAAAAGPLGSGRVTCNRSFRRHTRWPLRVLSISDHFGVRKHFLPIGARRLTDVRRTARRSLITLTPSSRSLSPSSSSPSVRAYTSIFVPLHPYPRSPPAPRPRFNVFPCTTRT